MPSKSVYYLATRHNQHFTKTKPKSIHTYSVSSKLEKKIVKIVLSIFSFEKAPHSNVPYFAAFKLQQNFQKLLKLKMFNFSNKTGRQTTLNFNHHSQFEKWFLWLNRNRNNF